MKYYWITYTIQHNKFIEIRNKGMFSDTQYLSQPDKVRMSLLKGEHPLIWNERQSKEICSQGGQREIFSINLINWKELTEEEYNEFSKLGCICSI